MDFLKMFGCRQCFVVPGKERDLGDGTSAHK